MKKIRFTASESVEIAVDQETVPIQHYLRQPQRLVRAIANPKLMEQLSEQRFRLKMRPLSFLDLYRFQPAVVLRVVANSEGTVFVNSEDCEILGNEYINQRFSLSLQGKLAPVQSQVGETLLKGRANLAVDVELPPPLWVAPKSLLETTGNGLLKGVLQRIKQRLLTQLLADYRQWANQDEQPQSAQLSSPLPAAENPTA